MSDNNIENSALAATGTFIHTYVKEDLGDDLSKIRTRFPPEPNGYLHIGHAKSICLNFGMAQQYGGKCNLRFDDTNPSKEDTEYVESIKEDIKWLGFDWEDRLYYASSYFEKMYECAVELIKKGLAFVCDLSAEEVRLSRGNLKEPGKESPYRNRSVEENLDLFARMRNGEFADGEKTLRAKIDMASPNMNMRDPVIYRIAHVSHHATGDKWCIYPMYDFAHPIEDAIEGITHSICTLEFEAHRPLYNWIVNNLDEFVVKPRQIEFAKLNLSNTIMGKRFMRNLVETGQVEGWDDPRLATICGLRHRGYTPESIRSFCAMVGVAKADSVVDTAMLEYCIREDLKPKAPAVMAVLDPIKVVITNLEESIPLKISVNPANPDMGQRDICIENTIYIDREDFMEEPVKGFRRLSPDKEVRLMSAFVIKCTDVIKDENGNITELHAEYNPDTFDGKHPEGRKVRGTIHWVNASTAVKGKVKLYENLLIEDENSDNGYALNPDSYKEQDCLFEPAVLTAKKGETERFQFYRNGYYAADFEHFTSEEPVFIRIVSLKSSYKPAKAN